MLYVRVARQSYRLCRYLDFCFARCRTCGQEWLWPPRRPRGSPLTAIRRETRAEMGRHVCVAPVVHE